MMLILPVQTFASAAMLGCAFSHQGQAMQQEQLKQAMVDDSMASCHEPNQTEQSPAPHNCKHCTSCHLVSALMVPAVAVAPVVSFAHSVIPHADDAFIGFIPDSPERPPRLAFA